MMKRIKIILAIFAMLLVGFNSYAQSSKNEISVEYGQFTLVEGGYLVGGVMGIMFSLGHFNFENTIMPGSLAVEYNRNVNSWFGYGGLASFEYVTSDTYSTDSEGNKTYGDKFNLGAATLMPTTHFFWFRNPTFGMYSKLGVGLGVAFGSDTSLFPAFQVSPVCMEFGGDKVKGLFELGVGIQGIAVLGIKRCF